MVYISYIKKKTEILQKIYTIGTATVILGVCIKALRPKERTKKIWCVRTPGEY
ncbi:MAG: hypothetical protein BAJALOKI3v1_130037 [Promethearchaeota archaeon]|nr:MAG: hypothetical protein BAJALOKI3v1_130037 [Candidatus Lokiarchaeota archaeon]